MRGPSCSCFVVDLLLQFEVYLLPLLTRFRLNAVLVHTVAVGVVALVVVGRCGSFVLMFVAVASGARVAIVGLVGEVTLDLALGSGIVVPQQL